MSLISSLVVTFSFLLPYHTQIRRTAFFPLSPIPTQRAHVLLQFDLADMI